MKPLQLAATLAATTTTAMVIGTQQSPALAAPTVPSHALDADVATTIVADVPAPETRVAPTVEAYEPAYVGASSSVYRTPWFLVPADKLMDAGWDPGAALAVGFFLPAGGAVLTTMAGALMGIAALARQVDGGAGAGSSYDAYSSSSERSSSSDGESSGPGVVEQAIGAALVGNIAARSENPAETILTYGAVTRLTNNPGLGAWAASNVAKPKDDSPFG